MKHVGSESRELVFKLLTLP
ncbi:rCG59747 [Rattus norvegicus]|uniref:RCG59747 n=1 Tax=Rattus norvegicus TaxID=10116 RepID=A6HQZ7_RAT|nr:rCG59747 [Rattus norvegicus]